MSHSGGYTTYTGWAFGTHRRIGESFARATAVPHGIRSGNALSTIQPGTTKQLGVRRCRIAGACPPVPLDLSHQRRVHDQVRERPDRGHVAGPEQPAGLHVDGHLAAVAARLVGDP